MDLYIFTIRDVKASVYQPPFCSTNANTAIRSFKRILTQDPMFKGFEEDYQLFQIGVYNDQTAALTPGEPAFIISALDCLGLKKYPQEEATEQDETVKLEDYR